MRSCWPVLLSLLFALAASAEAASSCQPSEVYEVARTPTGVRRDLDDDGVPDRLQVKDEDSGSAFYSARVEVQLSSLPRPVRITTGQSFESFLSFTEIPKELLAPGRRAAREAVAAALFGTVCRAPDASLAWLLDGRTLRWQNGPPELPDNYMIESANLTMAPTRAGRWPEAEIQLPRNPAWIGYLGVNHRRADSGSELSASFKVLAERPGQQLLGTAHGVVLVDTERNRHAWLYVQAGGQKLRWPTLTGARFDGQRALITVELGVAMRKGLVAVDLASGRVTSRFCDAQAWDASAQACRSP